MYDSIIIGSGPAGITASLYMIRAGLKVLIISKNQSALNKAEKIENYYGFEEPISGKDLNETGIRQAKRIGVEFLEKEVISLKYFENCYEVVVADQKIEEKYIAKTIVLATGTNRNMPNIKGIKEFEGKGISYCAICDAAFFKDKDVAVLGNGDYAIGEIKELLPVVKSVTMLTNGLTPNKHINMDNVSINTKKIKEFRGNNKIQEVEFEDNTAKEISGIFIAQGIATSVDFAKKLGAVIENNYIKVNEKMETTVPNIYAAGDCTGGLLQISKAVYEGMVAGIEIIKKIKIF